MGWFTGVITPERSLDRRVRGRAAPVDAGQPPP